MTTEEKARAYDKAIEKIKYVIGHNVLPTLNKDDLQDLFPELKEDNEDERIRKSIINLVIKSAQNGGMALHKWESQQMIAWLEKQGKQKSADKVEPKFHEGDWIIHYGTENIYKVVAIIDNQYQLKYGDTYTIQNCVDVDRCARLYDVAKDSKNKELSEEDEKSIRSRNSWKPSEEQMKALHDLNLTGEISYVGQGPCLLELYNKLKEL